MSQKSDWTSVQTTENGTSLKQQSSVLCLTCQPWMNVFSSSAFCQCWQSPVMWIYCWRYSWWAIIRLKQWAWNMLNYPCLGIFQPSFLSSSCTGNQKMFCFFYLSLLPHALKGYCYRTIVYSSGHWFILYGTDFLYQNKCFLPWTLEQTSMYLLVFFL